MNEKKKKENLEKNQWKTSLKLIGSNQKPG